MGSLYNNFQVNLRNAPVSTSGAEAADGQYLSLFFGSPWTGTEGGAERDHYVDHRTYPEAFRRARDTAQLGDVITGLGLLDNTFMGTVLLPLTYAGDALNFEWTVSTYETSVLEQTPEEAPSRTLKHGEEFYRDRLTRRGVAIIAEIGYMHTREGVANFARQVRQVVDSIHETYTADGLYALFNAHRTPQLWERQHGYVGLNTWERMLHEIEQYGLASWNSQAFQRFINQATQYAGRMGFKPDSMITEPRGFELMRGYHRAQRWYMFTGPDGSGARQQGPYSSNTYGDVYVYVTPALSAYDAQDRTPSMSKASMVGEFVEQVDWFADSKDPKERNIDDRSLYLYSQDKPGAVKWTMDMSLAACHVFHPETGEVQPFVQTWRDQPDKRWMFVFKYGTDENAYKNEVVRFWGQVESAYLSTKSFKNVAESVLKPLTEQDRADIKELVETARTIRDTGTLAGVAAAAAAARDVAALRQYLFALGEGAIRTNAGLASWLGMELLARADPKGPHARQVAAFKKLTRACERPFSGFSHVIDPALCPVYWREFVVDKAACVLWHAIVDDGTAPTYFAPAGARTNVGKNVFASFADVQEYVAEQSTIDALTAELRPKTEGVAKLVEKLAQKLREVSRAQLDDLESTAQSQFTDDQRIVIIAPVLFAKVLSAAKGNKEAFARIVKAGIAGAARQQAGIVNAADPDPANINPGDVIEHLDPDSTLAFMRKMQEQFRVDIGDAAANAIVAEWIISFNVMDGGQVDVPSPFVATRMTAREMAAAGRQLLYANPNDGFISAWHDVANYPGDAAAFDEKFDRATPSSFPYPGGKGFHEADYVEGSDGSYELASSESGGFASMFGHVPATGSNPRAAIQAAMPRAAIVRTGDFKLRSIHHAGWFLNELHWENSPSFVNNWNATLDENDIALKCAMAAFMFTRVCAKSCERIHAAKYVIPPYGFLLARPNWTHRMGGFLLTKSGPETGFTAYGNPIYMFEENTTLQTFEAHYTAYMKAIVLRPQNVIKWDNAYFEEYLGGGGHKACSQPFIDRWATNDFFPPAFQRGVPAVHVLMVSYEEREFDMIIDLMGTFSDPHIASQPRIEDDAEAKLTRKDLHYDSAMFYAQQHHYARMNKQRYGFMNYFEGPVANHALVRGWSLRQSELGEWNHMEPNRGHLKAVEENTHLIRSGRSIEEPGGKPLTVVF